MMNKIERIVAVEAVLIRENKVLLTLRAPDCEVAPNVWNVPAGKVRFLEIPEHAVVREMKEETGLDVKVVCELGVRAFMSHRGTYRLVFTYVVQDIEYGSKKDPVLNNEHSEYLWTDYENLKHFSSLNKDLYKLINDLLINTQQDDINNGRMP